MNGNDKPLMSDEEASKLVDHAREMHDVIKVTANELMSYWIGDQEGTTLDKIMSQIHWDTLRDGCAFFLALVSCLDDKTALLAVRTAINTTVATKVKADYIIAHEPEAPRSEGRAHEVDDGGGEVMS